MTMSDEDRGTLLAVASEAVERGVDGVTPQIDLASYPERLQQRRATFVTIRSRGSLRGCIGVTRAIRPLVTDVAHNAWAAANRDPRFAPVTSEELGELSYSISILTPPEPLAAGDRDELIAALRVGVDGLIIESDRHRAAFLPVMWDQIPSAERFLAHLEDKGGFVGGWEAGMRAWTFQAEHIE